jgi:hypothetical protein
MQLLVPEGFSSCKVISQRLKYIIKKENEKMTGNLQYKKDTVNIVLFP